MIGEVKILSNAEVTEQSILILVSTSILFSLRVCLTSGLAQIVSLPLYQYGFFVLLHSIAPDIYHDLEVRNN